MTQKHQSTDKLLTTAEVLELLRVGRTTLWRREADGTLPAAIRIGQRKLWRLTDIRRWLAAEAKKAARPLTA